LNAGLRWDGQWNPSTSTARVRNDLQQWQPRLGLAWNPVTKTVIRLSAGLYDSTTPARALQRAFTDDAITTRVVDSYFDPAVLGLVSGTTLQALTSLPTLATQSALVFRVDPEFRNPRSFQASGAIEQQLNAKLSVSASYIRNSTWDLLRYADRNLLPPTFDATGLPVFPATRPNGSIGQLLRAESRGHSSYDGLLVKLNAQLPHRSSVAVNYTLSRTRPDAPEFSFDGIGTLLDPFHPALDRADSTLDVRHNFNVSAIFNFVWGLKLNPIFIARSGAPYTPIVGFDTQRDANDYNDRAVINGAMAARNSLRQPSFANLDVRFVKDFTLPGEGHHLDLFLDVFNVTGAQNRNFGANSLSFYGNAASPVFSAGQPLFAPATTRYGSARQVQFTASLVAF